jgi:hypothetical protein
MSELVVKLSIMNRVLPLHIEFLPEISAVVSGLSLFKHYWNGWRKKVNCIALSATDDLISKST